MLAFLVDAPIRENPLRDDFQAPQSVTYEGYWVEQAEATRQDLQAAHAAVRAARYNVEVAFGQYYPTFGLNTGWSLYQTPFQPFTMWSTLLDLNVPIYTGGLINAKVRTAWSQYRSACLTESQLKRQIDQNVQTAYINLGLAHAELDELETQVVAARSEFYFAQMTLQKRQRNLSQCSPGPGDPPFRAASPSPASNSRRRRPTSISSEPPVN